MWLAIKALYTDAKAQVLYSGFLSRQFSVLQSTGQGEYLPPLCTRHMLNALSNHASALNINKVCSLLEWCFVI